MGSLAVGWGVAELVLLGRYYDALILELSAVGVLMICRGEAIRDHVEVVFRAGSVVFERCVSCSVVMARLFDRDNVACYYCRGCSIL